MIEKNNIMEEFNQFILNVFSRYEMVDAYRILSGVEIVGIKNCDVWLNLVEQMQEVKKEEKFIEESNGLDFLPTCLSLMKKMDKKLLRSALENQQNPSYLAFEDFLLGLSDSISSKSKSL